MCASSLGALYIYRRALLCELKDTEERNPCVWEVMVVVVVLSVCDCRALADSGSCFALVAVSLGGFIRDCLHLRRGFVYLRLRRFTFVIYNDFTTGEREKRSLSAVYFGPLFGCFYSLYYFQGSAVLTVLLWFIHPHVLSNLCEFLSFFPKIEKYGFWWNGRIY